MILFLEAVAGETSIEIPPTNTAAAVGDSFVRLNCSFLTDQDGPEYLEWVVWKGSRNTRISLNHKIHHPAGKAKYLILIDREHVPNEYAWSEGYDLVIKNVTLEDAAQYECSTLMEESRAFADLLVVGN